MTTMLIKIPIINSSLFSKKHSYTLNYKPQTLYVTANFHNTILERVCELHKRWKRNYRVEDISDTALTQTLLNTIKF